MERDENTLSAEAAASALIWWTDAGVDVLVDEAPRDWLRPKEKQAPAAVAEEAAAQTALPDQLELFQAWLRDSHEIPLASPSAPRVCPSGDPASGLMMITDMPAAEDCAAGTLISGKAGALFDRMLAAIGRDRNSIYLASLACFRSPDGRLTDAASKDCATLARHHVGLAAPKAVLLIGDAAAKALIGLPVMTARGRWHEISTRAGPVPAVATFPPAQLLDRPSFKAAAWADLQLLMQKLS